MSYQADDMQIAVNESTKGAWLAVDIVFSRSEGTAPRYTFKCPRMSNPPPAAGDLAVVETPTGMSIVRVVEVRSPTVSDRLRASKWLIMYGSTDGYEACKGADARVREALLAAAEEARLTAAIVRVLGGAAK